MIAAGNDRTFEFFINNNDMTAEGKPNFTTYNGLPLASGTIAINMDTRKGFFWDAEDEEWK